MSQCKITLTANAGAVVDCGGVRLWSDALHRKKVPGFSAVDSSLWKSTLGSAECSAPNFIIYSHKHPDHYSRTLTAQALALWPGARLIAPFCDFEGQTLLSGAQTRLSLPGVELRFAALSHEPGPGIAPLPHYGCLADFGGFRVLLTGDCALGDPALADLAGEAPVDVALLDFPWLTLRRGRAFVEQVLRPRHAVFCHLPFAADDVNGYRAAAERAAPLLASVPDVRLLEEPLQTETFEC